MYEENTIQVRETRTKKAQTIQKEGEFLHTLKPTCNVQRSMAPHTRFYITAESIDLAKFLDTGPTLVRFCVLHNHHHHQKNLHHSSLNELKIQFSSYRPFSCFSKLWVARTCLRKVWLLRNCTV